MGLGSKQTVKLSVKASFILALLAMGSCGFAGPAVN